MLTPIKYMIKNLGLTFKEVSEITGYPNVCKYIYGAQEPPKKLLIDLSNLIFNVRKVVNKYSQSVLDEVRAKNEGAKRLIVNPDLIKSENPDLPLKAILSCLGGLFCSFEGRVDFVYDAEEAVSVVND